MKIKLLNTNQQQTNEWIELECDNKLLLGKILAACEVLRELAFAKLNILLYRKPLTFLAGALISQRTQSPVAAFATIWSIKVILEITAFACDGAVFCESCSNITKWNDPLGLEIIIQVCSVILDLLLWICLMDDHQFILCWNNLITNYGYACWLNSFGWNAVYAINLLICNSPILGPPMLQQLQHTTHFVI